MTSVNFAELLEPIKGPFNCGKALDYDLDFLEFDLATRGKPDRQAGDQTVAGEAPDWPRVAELGLELAGRSKDVRIAIALARAWLATEGFAGLAAGLSLTAGYLDRFWEGLHPAPDADDDGDQTIRLNALANLGDPAGLLADIRRVPLVAARGIGSFSFNDWQAAGYGNSETLSEIEGAFGKTDPASLDEASVAIASCLDALGSIDVSIRARVEPGEMIRLDPLREALTRVKSVIDDHRPWRAGTAETGASAEGDLPKRMAGEITSRADVIGRLDHICQWYRSNEPSSPVPVMLERAKQMVSRDFLTLLMELAPDGTSQFRNIAGLRSAEGDEE
jgi:type VI secretion system protein ImpA